MKLVLHNYWRSSASQRVRIALGLKQLAYDYVVVNIIAPGGGEQFAAEYRARNPMQQVPTLEVTAADGTRRALVQSLPILEWLDETFPTPPILPADPYLRARCRALAEIINSGIQPHQNLTTTRRVKEAGVDDKTWPRPFIADGLAAYAAACADVAGAFSIGDTPTIADCCLFPQLASARRFGVDVAQFASLVAIEARCLALPAFADSAPERQVDAVRN